MGNSMISDHRKREDKRGDLRLAGYCNLRRMQERNVRSKRPALSAPIYQLHLLRSQTYDPGCTSI